MDYLNFEMDIDLSIFDNPIADLYCEENMSLIEENWALHTELDYLKKQLIKKDRKIQRMEEYMLDCQCREQVPVVIDLTMD